MKPHMKVIQRNGVDIFVTSSMVMKNSKAEMSNNKRAYDAMRNAAPNALIGDQSINPNMLVGAQIVKLNYNPEYLPPLAGKMYNRIKSI